MIDMIKRWWRPPVTQDRPFTTEVGPVTLEDGTPIPGVWRIWKDDLDQIYMMQRIR